MTSRLPRSSHPTATWPVRHTLAKPAAANDTGDDALPAYLLDIEDAFSGSPLTASIRNLALVTPPRYRFFRDTVHLSDQQSASTSCSDERVRYRRFDTVKPALDHQLGHLPDPPLTHRIA